MFLKMGPRCPIPWTYYENVTFTLADNGLTLLESDCGEKEMALGEVCLNLTKKQ